jgi:hypothetical protein
MNTKERGDLTEAKVVPILMELGYSVSIPFGENNRYDVIADSGESLYRCQIKTARKDDKLIIFNVSDTRHNRTQNTRRQYTSEDIDVFIAYSPELDQAYWIPVEDTPKTEMALRLEEPDSKYANTHNANWAEEYELR